MALKNIFLRDDISSLILKVLFQVYSAFRNEDFMPALSVRMSEKKYQE
jgi:hypothetical protein